jgi:hypothetical protein
MAGGKNLYPFEGCKTPGLAIFCGSFTTAGDATAVTGVNGAGFTVGNPASGVHTITLTDGPWKQVIAAFVELEDATVNANDTVRWGDTDSLLTTKAATIITASAAGTDASLSGPRVHFMLILSSSALRR